MIEVPGNKVAPAGDGSTPIGTPSKEAILMAVGLMHQMGRFQVASNEDALKQLKAGMNSGKRQNTTRS